MVESDAPGDATVQSGHCCRSDLQLVTVVTCFEPATGASTVERDHEIHHARLARASATKATAPGRFPEFSG